MVYFHNSAHPPSEKTAGIVLAEGTVMPSCKHYPKELGKKMNIPATDLNAGEIYLWRSNCVPSPGRKTSLSTFSVNTNTSVYSGGFCRVVGEHCKIDGSAVCG